MTITLMTGNIDYRVYALGDDYGLRVRLSMEGTAIIILVDVPLRCFN